MTEGPSRTHAILKKYARDIHAGWMGELADGLQLDRRIPGPNFPRRRASSLLCSRPPWLVME